MRKKFLTFSRIYGKIREQVEIVKVVILEFYRNEDTRGWYYREKEKEK